MLQKVILLCYNVITVMKGGSSMVQGREGINKVRLTVTIDEELSKKLLSYTTATMLAKSPVVNKALEEYLNEHYPSYMNEKEQ